MPALAGAQTQDAEMSDCLPPVKKLAWLLVREAERLTEKEWMTLRQRCQDRTIEQACALAQEFARMIRQGIAATIDPWLNACRDSDVTNLQTFGEGIKRDYDAIRAALDTTSSNRQTGGQVNRLKMLKPQMYGRAGLDLLRNPFYTGPVSRKMRKSPLL